MGDQELLKRLPYHAEGNAVPPFQMKRLLRSGRVLAVVTPNENGVNLYPGPKLITR